MFGFIHIFYSLFHSSSFMLSSSILYFNMVPRWSPNFRISNDLFNKQFPQLPDTTASMEEVVFDKLSLVHHCRRMFLHLRVSSLLLYPTMYPYWSSMYAPPSPNFDPITDAPPSTKASTTNTTLLPPFNYQYPPSYPMGIHMVLLHMDGMLFLLFPPPVWFSSPIWCSSFIWCSSLILFFYCHDNALK